MMDHGQLLLATFICCFSCARSSFVSDQTVESMDVQTLQKAFFNMQQQINQMEMRLESVEAENRRQSSEIIQLKENLANAEYRVEGDRDGTELQKEDIPDTSESTNIVRRDQGLPQTRIRSADTPMDVAFFAKVKAEVHHLGLNQDIIFDEAVTNIGNAYNPNHGLFVAPMSGTYVFSTTILTYLHDSAHFGFALNGNQITIMWTNGRDSTGDSDSQTIILNLNKGDDVSVKVTQQINTGLHGDGHSVFSGFRLPHVQGDSEIIG